MIKVLDISFWQGDIDFNKVKSAGYNYIILRAGYGTTKDSKFDEYAKLCTAAGIKIGAYFFSYATNVNEAKKEAQTCVNIIKNYDIKLPVFYDFEYDTVKKATQKGITLGKNECSSFTVAFCEEIKRLGYTPGFYANTDYYTNMYTDVVKNKGYVFWLAHYKTDRSYHTPPIKCDFFQYSDQGKVNGMSGNAVDLDVCFTEKYLDCTNNQQEGNNNMSNIVQKVIDDAVDFAVGIANDNSHGYSQAVRSLYNITNPTSFDCSSLVCTAFYYAFVKNGITPTPKDKGCSYTGNMLNLLNCGFEIVATNQTAHAQMKKGDIELNTTYHTALAIDGDNIVHARSSEGTSDTKDNSGNEIRKQPWYLYSHGWTHRLRFTGKGLNLNNLNPDNSVSTPTTPSSTLNKTTKWVGIVTANSLNVRTYAGTENALCSFSPLKKGIEVNVCDSVDGWYYIQYQGKYGFVSGEYIEKKTTTTTPSTPTTSVKPIVIVKSNEVEFPQFIAGRCPEGDAVGVLQTILKVPVTNKWDATTTNAVRVFKRNVGLADNGNVGPDVWKLLMKHICSLVKNTK